VTRGEGAQLHDPYIAPSHHPGQLLEQPERDLRPALQQLDEDLGRQDSEQRVLTGDDTRRAQIAVDCSEFAEAIPGPERGEGDPAARRPGVQNVGAAPDDEKDLAAGRAIL
jgi:hypothetical protein